MNSLKIYYIFKKIFDNCIHIYIYIYVYRKLNLGEIMVFVF